MMLNANRPACAGRFAFEARNSSGHPGVGCRATWNKPDDHSHNHAEPAPLRATVRRALAGQTRPTAIMPGRQKPRNGHTGPKPSWFTPVRAEDRAARRPADHLHAGDPGPRSFVWGVTGPLFGYSDTWQLVINNSGTTIVHLPHGLPHLAAHPEPGFAGKRSRSSFFRRCADSSSCTALGNEIAGDFEGTSATARILEKLHETYRNRAAHAHDTLEKRREQIQK